MNRYLTKHAFLAIFVVGLSLLSLLKGIHITSTFISDLDGQKTSAVLPLHHSDVNFNAIVHNAPPDTVRVHNVYDRIAAYSATNTKTNTIVASKYIYTCHSGCIDFSPSLPAPACIGGYNSNNGRRYPWDQVSFDNTSIVDTINITGDTLSIYIRHENINHAFHDEMFSALAWLYRLKKQMTLLDNLNIIIHANMHPWSSELLRLCNVTFHWLAHSVEQLISSQKENSSTIVCSEEGSMFMNGYLRNIRKYGLSVIELKQMRQEMREAALEEVRVRHMLSNKDDPRLNIHGQKEQIIIYTRQDTSYRNLLEVEKIAALFDSKKYNISVVHSIPMDFYDQVELFDSADLFIAPNGGWNPNILWMSNEACLIELHLYREDSWLNMFGLVDLFEKGRFMAITGDYSDSNAQRIKRPGRKGGGDDIILGSLVVSDIENALRMSSTTCGRFLKDVNEMGHVVSERNNSSNKSGPLLYLEIPQIRKCGLGHW